MTTDGYWVDAWSTGANRPLLPMPVVLATDLHEWQERHADLNTTLRTILAMCAHTEQHHPGGPAHLARSIRSVIEQASERPGR